MQRAAPLHAAHEPRVHCAQRWRLQRAAVVACVLQLQRLQCAAPVLAVLFVVKSCIACSVQPTMAARDHRPHCAQHW